MANVLFKQGTQTALDAIRTAKSASDGTFYLTSDSRRLYIGTSTGDAVPVNEGVTSVNSTDDLPKGMQNAQLHAGQFYYATSQNILCVFNGKSWVQINPNTNTTVDGIDITATVSGNVASIKTKLTLNGVVNADGTTTDGKTITDTYKVEGDGGITVAVNATGDGVILTGDSYGLGNTVNETDNIAKITLTSQNTDNDTEVNIKGGSNVTLSQEGDNIRIDTKNTTLGSVKSGNGEKASDTATNKQGIYVTIADSDGKSGTAHINPSFQVGVASGYQESVKIINGTASLPVYSKSEIDAKMLALDAMSYCGTLGAGGSSLTLNTSALHNGDTYLVVDEEGFTITVNGTTIEAKKGDMLIARGTENATTGLIDPTTLALDYVPSGDDAKQDTTYKVVPTTHGIKIQTNQGGSTIGTITVVGDDVYTEAEDTTGTTSNTITIKHKTLEGGASSAATNTTDAASQQFNTTYTVPVVDSVVRDAAGHVTGVNVKKYYFKDTNGKLTENKYTVTADAATNVVTVSNSVTMKTSSGANAGTVSHAFGVTSNTMKVTSSNETISVELEWGSF